MSNLAQNAQYSQQFMLSGLVLAEQEGMYQIKTECGIYQAKKAFACLVTPVLSDVVLLSFNAQGQAYILSILERTADLPAELSLKGDVNFSVKQGSFALHAEQGLHLLANQDLGIAAGSLALHTEQASVQVGNLSFLGGLVQTQMAKLHLVAESVDNIISRLTQRLKFNVRFVDEVEEVQAASMRHLVEGQLTLQAKSASLVAEEHIKIDAEQIHLA